MDIIKLNDKDFVLFNCTREEAFAQMPKDNAFRFMALYQDEKSSDPLKRYAYAIFYAPYYHPIFNRGDHELIYNELQNKYDMARKKLFPENDQLAKCLECPYGPNAKEIQPFDEKHPCFVCK